MGKPKRRVRLFREKVQQIVNQIIDKQMEKKTFYRVGHVDNQQGLWYKPTGEFTGDIHDKYEFCANTNLQMPFDPELVGWISATPTMEELLFWFPIEDINKLELHGYRIMIYEACDYKDYVHKDYTHTVIKQSSSKLIGIVDRQHACIDEV